MSYNSLPAEAVLSAFRSMMYISYWEKTVDKHVKLWTVCVIDKERLCKESTGINIYQVLGAYLYGEIRRVQGSGCYEPCFSRAGVCRDQLASSFHQELAVFLRRHVSCLSRSTGFLTSHASSSWHQCGPFFGAPVYPWIHRKGGQVRSRLVSENSRNKRKTANLAARC